VIETYDCRWEEIVTGFNQYIVEFAATHNGFRPGACATYFVHRVPEKPHGWFSMKGEGYEHSGLSFTMDPIYHDPTSPVWQEFVQGANRFAVTHGGRVALSQTRMVTREIFLSGAGMRALREAPNKRFTTPFFKQFVEESADVVESP
jgi:hypothetical protein